MNLYLYCRQHKHHVAINIYYTIQLLITEINLFFLYIKNYNRNTSTTTATTTTTTTNSSSDYKQFTSLLFINYELQQKQNLHHHHLQQQPPEQEQHEYKLQHNKEKLKFKQRVISFDIYYRILFIYLFCFCNINPIFALSSSSLPSSSSTSTSSSYISSYRTSSLETPQQQQQKLLLSSSASQTTTATNRSSSSSSSSSGSGSSGSNSSSGISSKNRTTTNNNSTSQKLPQSIYVKLYELNITDAILTFQHSCSSNYSTYFLQNMTNLIRERYKCENMTTQSLEHLAKREQTLIRLINEYIDIDNLNKINEICSSEKMFTNKTKLENYFDSTCNNIFANSISETQFEEIINEFKPKKTNRKKPHNNSNNLTTNPHNKYKFHTDYSNTTTHSAYLYEFYDSYLQSSSSYSAFNTFNNLIVPIDDNKNYKTVTTTHSSSLKSTLSSSSSSSSSSVVSNSSQTFSLFNEILNSNANCKIVLLKLLLAAQSAKCEYTRFKDTLDQYDCITNNFSVKSGCDKCKNAYKRWLCTIKIPYYQKNTIIKPCKSYCYKVQNTCPFLRPIDEDKFGGQPVFHCKNIPEDDDDNIEYNEKCYSEENGKFEIVDELHINKATKQNSNTYFLLLYVLIQMIHHL